MLLTKSVINKIKNWYATELGKRLLSQENIILNKLIAKTPRTIGIQTSFTGINNLVKANIDNTINFLVTTTTEDISNQVAIIIDPENMPIIPDIVDLFILQHILEFYPNPKNIIKEAARSLTPSGKLIICGFNPTSFINLFKSLNSNLKTTFKEANFISIGKLCYWLREYNLNVLVIKYNGFLISNKLYKMKLGKKLETMFNKRNSSLGFCYTILATKEKYCRIKQMDFFNGVNSSLYPNAVPKPNLGKTFD